MVLFFPGQNFIWRQSNFTRETIISVQISTVEKVWGWAKIWWDMVQFLTTSNFIISTQFLSAIYSARNVRVRYIFKLKHTIFIPMEIPCQLPCKIVTSLPNPDNLVCLAILKYLYPNEMSNLLCHVLCMSK